MDVVLKGKNSSLLEVQGLHIDENTGSPTLYHFQLCVRDYHNLTDIANVTVVYRKGNSFSIVSCINPLCVLH